MAATTTFPSLSVPAPEDSMEIASPAQQYDGDIDLDFGDDDYNGGVQITEDEHMLTDGEQTRPATATDDMMDDDLQLVQTHEADMQDTPDVDQQQQYEPADEELIDYGEEEAAHSYTEDATLVNADDGFNTFQERTEQADEEIVQQPEDFFPTIDTDLAPADVQVHSIEANVDVPNDDNVAAARGDQAEAQQQSRVELFANENQTALEHEDVTLAPTTDVLHEDELLAVESDHPVTQPALTLDTTTYPDYEQPATPTDTGLHPMTIYYGDHAMPLFKSKRQPEGLLKDDNLASLSLHELLTKCRERLVMKLGNIPEEQEFTLSFDHLGLLLVENSRAAFEHSLNDVLEIYLQLHSNDGVTECLPLSLTLTHQQFSGQLAILKQAAQAGNGMSHFQPTDENAEEYFEENEEHEENQESGGACGEQGDHVAEQQLQEHGEHDQQGYQEEYQEGEEDYEAQEGYAQDAQEGYESQHFTEYAADVPGEHVDGADKYNAEAVLPAEQDQERAVLDVREDDVSAQHPGETAHGQDRGDAQDQSATDVQPAADAEEAEDFVEHDASLNSSVTLQGDHASGTGEYKQEEEIDWDDEVDLTGNVSDLPADEIDEFSTFVADLETDEAHAAEQPLSTEHGQQSVVADDASKAHEAEVSAEHDQGLHLGSEDLLGQGEFNEEPHEDVEPHDEEHPENDEHDFYQDQADTYDKQQADQHDEAGAEDEQYQITDEFANEEAYENGDEIQVIEETQKPAEDDTNTNGEHRKTNELDTLDLEETIDFDDDTPAEYAARTASNPDISAAANGTNSPTGKRSFDEHNAEDDLDFSDDDEPDMKKVRSE